jgi:Leucine rich repeat
MLAPDCRGRQRAPPRPKAVETSKCSQSQGVISAVNSTKQCLTQESACAHAWALWHMCSYVNGLISKCGWHRILGPKKMIGQATFGFTGSLPGSWGTSGAFQQLEKLDLANVNLTGTLPAAWGQAGAFPKLKELNLERNSFTGPLPPSWSSLANLQVLSISSNSLSGGRILLPARLVNRWGYDRWGKPLGL